MSVWLTSSELNNFQEKILHGLDNVCWNWNGQIATSVLTEDQVRRVRQRLSQGHTRASIAADFGVSRVTVTCISTGRIWAWLST